MMKKRIMKKRLRRPQLEDEYKVGYGKPPKETRFKPGQSGNPKGRPKNSKNTFELLQKEVDKQIILKEGGKEVKLTKKQAMLRHLINKAVQGDTRSMFFLFNQLLSLDVKEEEKIKLVEDISETDKEILMNFLKTSTEVGTKGENNV